MKFDHGGKRANAGKPKGVKWPSTLAKEEAREKFRKIVTAATPRMLEAQIAHAEGIKYLVARHVKTGKFAKLTEELALAIENGENRDFESIEVWTKDPSVQAFTDLMNRALDKPKEQDQTVHVNHSLDERILAILHAGRKRLTE